MVESLNKPYQKLRRELIGEYPGDLDLGILRLLQLGQVRPAEGDVYVERGITDYLEHFTAAGGFRRDAEWIRPWVNRETEALEKLGKPWRVLLVMEDTEFIQRTILKDPLRARTYPDLESYLTRQSEYVQFTKNWNQVDEEIRIPDAMSYLKDVLQIPVVE